MKISPEDAENFEKFGVEFWDYLSDSGEVDILRESTEAGHLEEFYNEKCTYYYFVLEGQASFFLDGEEVEAEERDLVTVEPGTKCYYLGDVELLLICTPKWTEEQHNFVRYVDENGDTVPEEEAVSN
jgi:mannose-6-phosphate isomerase-like protein (cupin superfamily)